MKNIEKYIIVILSFIAVGAIGTAVYFGVNNKQLKENDKTSEVDKQNEHSEKLNKDSKEVKSLFKKVDFDNDFMILNASEKYWEMLSKEKVTAKELSDKIRLLMAVNFNGKDSIKNGPGLHMDNNTLEYPNYVRYVEEQEIKNGFDSVFGDNATYHKVDALNICENYIYEARDNRYVTYDGGCGDLLDIAYIEEILTAEKYSDRIEIITGVAYCNLDETACYKDYERKEEIKNIVSSKNFNINDYIDDIYQYKYIFTKDKQNSDYYFYSIEKVK